MSLKSEEEDELRRLLANESKPRHENIRQRILETRRGGNRAPSDRMHERMALGLQPTQPLPKLSYSTATKWRDILKGGEYDKDESAYDLLKALADTNEGVSYNSYLTTEETAKRWLAKKQAEDARKGTSDYKGWQIDVEDLDSNPATPDDIIMVDAEGIPQIVSGYRLNDGRSRRKAAVFYNQYPDKRVGAAVRKGVKAAQQSRLLNRWLAQQSENATRQIPYSMNWLEDTIRRRPKLDPTYYTKDENKHPYQLLRSYVFAALKKAGFSTDPMFFYIAQEALAQVYDELKKTTGNNKADMRTQITSGNAGLAAVNYYKQLAPIMKEYELQNPVPIFTGFRKRPVSKIIKEEPV
jgi:hypothetical protein